MSLHRSLKIYKWSGRRSVRKRRERLETLYAGLLKQGGLSDKDIKIYGLSKEKILRLKKTKKEEKKEEKTDSLLSYGK